MGGANLDSGEGAYISSSLIQHNYHTCTPEIRPVIEIDYIEPAGYVGPLYLTTD